MGIGRQGGREWGGREGGGEREGGERERGGGEGERERVVCLFRQSLLRNFDNFLLNRVYVHTLEVCVILTPLYILY